MYDLEITEVNLNNKAEVAEVEDFLKSLNLRLDKDIDYTIVIKQNNEVKATCSTYKNILKCFGIAEELRGEGIAAKLVSTLINKQFEAGIYNSFIFTKPSNIEIFSSLNFKLLYEGKQAALMENGISDINSTLSNLIKKYEINVEVPKAALVMNCNPFTLGHRYLIEKAANENAEVLVFVVQEEKSLFPFVVRYELVKKGVEDLSNVKVIPAGQYIISQATFPDYFLRNESDRFQSYIEIDAGIFAKYFCSKLNIKTRYVGTEPYCQVTNQYNEALKVVLKKHGVQLIEVDRKENQEGAISASRVREAIKQGELDKLETLLPQVTIEFLKSRENLGRV